MYWGGRDTGAGSQSCHHCTRQLRFFAPVAGDIVLKPRRLATGRQRHLIRQQTRPKAPRGAREDIPASACYRGRLPGISSPFQRELFECSAIKIRAASNCSPVSKQRGEIDLIQTPATHSMMMLRMCSRRISHFLPLQSDQAELGQRATSVQPWRLTAIMVKTNQTRWTRSEAERNGGKFENPVKTGAEGRGRRKMLDRRSAATRTRGRSSLSPYKRITQAKDPKPMQQEKRAI
jgi:hypothetical protein